ncbi:MAG: hypothetical protein U1F53_02495 [Burkholderiaceae bacterium]
MDRRAEQAAHARAAVRRGLAALVLLAWSALSALSAGCATAPGGALGGPSSLWQDAAFAPPAEPVDPGRVFALSPAMRDALRRRIEPLAQALGPQRALFEALYSSQQLALAYDGELVELYGHVNVSIGKPVPLVRTHEDGPRGRVDEAYWWVRAATETDPAFTDAYNTLGRASDYHEFHFWLALSYLRLGERERAAQHLRLAEENASTRQQQRAYAAKLQRLKAAGAAGEGG